MQRLRHPVRAIREPFGKAGLTVAILALVLAMVGGAYAAGGLTKSQEKQVTKIAKKYAGKPGAAGAAGAAGTPGTPGTNGAAGKNGKEGAEGPKGSPWTAGGTLPSGATETGAWVTQMPEGETGTALISFTLPLTSALAYHSKAEEEGGEGANQLHFILDNKKEVREEVEETQTVCTGSAAEPKAAKGNLCVYLGYRTNNAFSPLLFHKVTAPPALGSDTAGTGYVIENLAPTSIAVEGTWAVTAP